MEDRNESCDELLYADGIKAYLKKSEQYADLSLVLFVASLFAGLINSYTGYVFIYGWPIVVGLCYIAYVFKSFSSNAQIQALELYSKLSLAMLDQFEADGAKTEN